MILDFLDDKPVYDFEPLFECGMFVDVYTEDCSYVGKIIGEKPQWLSNYADHEYLVLCFNDCTPRCFLGSEISQRKNTRSVTYALMKALSIKGGRK